MNLIEAIIKRRSIRRYKQQKVEQEKIEAILRAAMYAPSAVNKQPWHFIVIDDRKILNKVMDIHPNAKMLDSASHAILVCGDEKLQHDKGYWVADCGAATENLLLAVKSIDLGACWIGVYPREQRMAAFKELFHLPGHVQPFALVSIGYPAEEKEIPERYKADRIYLNRWKNPF